MSKISVVIPCYRSEHTLGEVVDGLIDLFEEQNEYEYEIILVDDGSPDDVWNVICKLTAKNDKVKGILFSKNFGQHAALMAGYRESTGDYIVSMDDDGQTKIEGIWSLIEKLNQGYDVVYAKYPELKENIFRKFGSWINRKMAEVLIGKPKNIKGTSFNVIRRFVIEEMIRYNNSYPYIGGLVFRSTSSIGEVEIEHKERINGKSGYTIGKLLKLWINGFTAFSEKPLRIATIIGVLCSGVGFLYAIFIVVRKLCNPNIQLGYSSLLSVILFIGGILMLLLGIIGEYVGRIYISINTAPQYVIKEKSSKKED